MATFLELCADVARESGAVGSAPTSVLNQTGRQLKCVEWVRKAWQQIQNDYNGGWSFLRNDFSGALSINVANYLATTFTITSFAKWLDETSDYQPITLYESGFQDQEQPLKFISYQRWKTIYDRGVHDANRPVHWSIKPDGSLLVGPKPDKPYIIRGEYQRAPQILGADADVPIMPDRYHDAIVWRACVMLAEHDEASVARQSAALKYDPVHRDMLRDLLPCFELGGNELA